MTESKEVKGIFLCESFKDRFCYKAKVIVNNPRRFFTDLDDFNDSVIDYINIFDKNDVELRSFILGDYVSVFRFNASSYCFEFSFHLSTGIVHLDVCNASKKLCGCTFIFDEYEFVSFFHDDEENAPEPEQPEEDAEEQDNLEQTPAEDAEEQSEMIDTNMGAMPIEDYHDILAYQHGFDSYEEFKKAWCSDDEEFNTSEPELTPLERIIFRERDTCIERYSLFSEKAEEAENDDEYDNYRFDASVAIRIADYLEYIIMEVGLTEKWYSWLEARQKARKGG